jgi:hypothetical protein
MGFARNFEQQIFEGEDTTVFSLMKFMKLCLENNPNIVELLYAPEDCIQVCTPLWEKLRARRDEIISAKCYYTFTGYAHSQLNRLKGHREWLRNPVTRKPTREEFGLTQAGQGVREIAKGVDVSEIAPEALVIIEKEKAYKAASRRWSDYQKWLEERNPARAKLEASYGYDCYLDDTEFLTERGWKRYDEIGHERLATLHQASGSLEFQHYSERVAKDYSGPIMFFETRASACAVTPNHRMWVSESCGGRGNEHGTRYDAGRAAWKITTAEVMTTGKRYRYHVRTATEGAVDPQTISEEMLITVGAYVSEGCVAKRLVGGSPSVLRFSQKAGGRLEPYLEQLMKSTPGVRRYAIDRNEAYRNTRITEMVYTLANRATAVEIVGWCGEGSATKHLPPWITRLCKQDARLLLDVLVAGDGTNRKYSRIYYTQSRQLADDVQILAVVAGLTAKVWGPYPDKRQPNSPAMYQVYIAGEGFSSVVALGKQSHVRIENVIDRRIVCFTVPNEILITRRCGKVAVQGNTKHALHLVRLLRMGYEILTTGKVIVRRPDAEELLAIRNGLYTLDELLEKVEELKTKLDAVYEAKTYVVPFGPPHQEMSDFAVELHDEYWKQYAKHPVEA